MSIHLIREVFDYAPADLKPAELVVLIALAEDARDDRISKFASHDKLIQRTRLSRRTLYRAIDQLESAGLIWRVGAAHKGRIQQYRLAQLQAHHQATVIHLNGHRKGDTDDTLTDLPKGDTDDTHSPVDTSNHGPPKGCQTIAQRVPPVSPHPYKR